MEDILNVGISCPLLKNSTVLSNVVPLRITVNVDSPSLEEKCLRHMNIVNSVISAIKMPVNIDFSYPIGRLVNGTWNGSIGRLVNNESDVAIGTFTATYQRFQWTQLSSMLGYSSPVAILTGRLSARSVQSQFQVFNTFSLGVWFGIVVSIVTIGIISNLLHDSHWKNVISNIINIYQLMFGQSVDQYSRICCVKHTILIGVCLYSFNILIQYFNTLILSNLISDPVIKIDSIKDLVNFIKLNNKNVTLVSDKTYLTWYLLENSPDENFHSIFKLLLDTKYDIADIFNGKSIAINYGHILQHVYNANKHLGLYFGREQYFGSEIVMLYSKSIDAIFKEKIDLLINILFESGLQHFWEHLWYYRLVNLNQTANDDSILVQITYLMMLFSIIYSIIFLLFLIEYFTYRYYNYSKNI